MRRYDRRDIHALLCYLRRYRGAGGGRTAMDAGGLQSAHRGGARPGGRGRGADVDGELR